MNLRIEQPESLWWLLSLVVVVALYLLRRRPVARRVSTLAFFKALAREHQEAHWLRRLKQLLAFLMSVVLVGGAVVVLARPLSAPQIGGLASVVILFDTSASMGAGTPPPLERARIEAGARVDGLAPSVEVMVIAYDRRPRILVPRTLDREAVRGAITGLRPRAVAGRPHQALGFAGRLAALARPSEIWHYSDHDVADEGIDGAIVDRRTFPHVDPVNVGITAFSIRRQPLSAGELEAFLRVEAIAPAPLPVELSVHVDGELIALRSLTIEPGVGESLVVPVVAGDGDVLTVQATASGDMLRQDDRVDSPIGDLEPARVLWVREDGDPFVQLALRALVEADLALVYEATPADWPPDPTIDVVILDGWLPAEWPADHPVLVLEPPASLGPLLAAPIPDGGLPIDSLRAIDHGHPLLYGVASARVALTQTAVLESVGALEPIWVGPKGPVLLAGEERGQRIAILAVAAGRSSRLPLLASFPLLLANAVTWLAEPEFESRSRTGSVRATGEVIEVAGEDIEWAVTAPDGGQKVERVSLADSGLVELDRVGCWRAADGSEGAAALLSVAETRLGHGLVPPDSPAAPLPPPPLGAAWLTGDLRPALLWLLFVVAVVELWLFHRHAVY